MAGASAAPACWLVKTESEPHLLKGVDVSYAFQRYLDAPGRVGPFFGVRNFQARNNLRAMAVGDTVLVYHSGCKKACNIGVAGLATVARAAYADPDAQDAASPFFDEKATHDPARWVRVNLCGTRALAPLVPLATLKAEPGLADCSLLRQGRLSVHRIEQKHVDAVLALEARLAGGGAGADAGVTAAAGASAGGAGAGAAVQVSGAKPAPSAAKKRKGAPPAAATAGAAFGAGAASTADSAVAGEAGAAVGGKKKVRR